MSKRLSIYLILVLVSVIWGIAGPIIKYTLGDIPPLIFLTYRFAISALVAIIIFSIQKPYLPRKTGASITIFIYGLLTTTVSLGLLFLGYDKTTALTATLLTSVAPVFTAIAGVMFFHDRVTKIERIGFMIAFLGTLVTILEPFFDGKGYSLITSLEGNLLVLASLVVGVVLSVQSKYLLRDHTDPGTLTHISFIIGFITILPIVIVYHTPSEILGTIIHAPLSAHLGVWYMALLSGTLAYTLWHKGQKAIEISEAAVFTYLYPIWAAPLAIFWLGEKLTMGVIVGATLIGAGVVIAEFKKGARRGTQSPRKSGTSKRR